MSVPRTAVRDDDPVVDRLADIGRSPILIVGEGTLSMVLGVVVLTWPGPTATVLALLFGIYLLGAGVLQLVGAFAGAPAAGGRALPCVLGTLSILVGLLCLRSPLQTLLVLGLLIGVTWVVGGVIRVVQGIAFARGAARGWRIASGVVSVVAGVLVLLYPEASLVVLRSVLGVVLLVEGACLIGAGLTIRRTQSDARVITGTAPSRTTAVPPIPPPVRL